MCEALNDLECGHAFLKKEAGELTRRSPFGSATLRVTHSLPQSHGVGDRGRWDCFWTGPKRIPNSE